MTDKKVGVFGNSENSLQVAFSLGWFTPYITLFSQGLFEVSPEFRQQLKEHGYPLVEKPIKHFCDRRS
jgi:thioredoxin reductase (NADPH)